MRRAFPFPLAPLLPAILIAAVACDDALLPVEPLNPGGPSFVIEDAVHNYGNLHFYWLPPTVPNAPAFGGQPNINFYPVIELCEWTGSACAAGPPIGKWGRGGGTNYNKIYQSSVTQKYSLIAQTSNLGLDPAKTYRARLFLIRTQVGFIDVDVVATRAEVDGVDRANFTPLVLGEALNLHFRLEYGAMYPVVPKGGTLSVLGGAVTLQYAPGAMAAELGIMVQPAHEELLPLVTDAGSGADRLAEGTAYEIGPEQIIFGAPGQLTLQYDETRLTPGTSESQLRLHTLQNGVWAQVPGSTVDETNNSVTGTIGGTGIYAVVALHPTDNVMASGGHHNCKLDSSGQAYCWGYNWYGQIGDGQAYGAGTASDYRTPSPSAVAGGHAFTAIYAGAWHTCALTTAGQAYCWGYNVHGQLGAGYASSYPYGVSTPQAVQQGSLVFTELALGSTHTCGLTAGGQAYCWGYGGGGALGTGGSSSSSMPVAVSGLSFASLAAGESFTCGLTAGGGAHCWGYNYYGTVGNGASGYNGGSPNIANYYVYAPSPVVGGHSFAQLDGSLVHACGVTTAGAAYCWGYNYYGELGNGAAGATSGGSQIVVPTPQAVVGGYTFQSVTTGGFHSCGVTDDNAAHCWGNNSSGGLGNGSIGGNPFWTTSPGAVSGGLSFAALDAGYYHTCGLTTSGEMRCWGNNGEGEQGNGTFGAPVPSPGAPVVLPTP